MSPNNNSNSWGEVVLVIIIIMIRGVLNPSHHRGEEVEVAVDWVAEEGEDMVAVMVVVVHL